MLHKNSLFSIDIYIIKTALNLL